MKMGKLNHNGRDVTWELKEGGIKVLCKRDRFGGAKVLIVSK